MTRPSSPSTITRSLFLTRLLTFPTPTTAGISSARATAAVVKSAATGSLILLNRENDCIPMEGGNQTQCGVNLLVQANDNQGMNALQADGGISRLYAWDGLGPPRWLEGVEFGGVNPEAIDACEDVGNTLERIVLKNG